MLLFYSSLVANQNKTACVPPATPPGKGDGPPGCDDNQVQRGNPINVGTGLKAQVEIDYRALSGLEFKRMYNSMSAYETPAQLALGQGWRTDWNRMIQGSPSAPPTYPPAIDYTVYRLGLAPNLTPDTTIVTAYVSRGDGQTLTYTRSGSGSAWQADADLNGQLSSQFDAAGKLTAWTYVTPEHYTEQYNASGKLTSITDRVGQTQTLDYSDGTPSGGYYVFDASGAPTTEILPGGLLTRITDAYGRSLSFGYDAQSRIVKMTDPAEGAYIYTYDANDNLSTVTYPDGNPKQYLYENTTFVHALTGIMDENGDRYATYGYDSTGRATSTEHAGGAEKVTVAYNSDGTSTVTDALGTARTQTFQKVLGLNRNGGASQPGGSGCGAANSNMTYDGNGNVASRTDFNGNITTYQYDLARNLETSRTEAFGTQQARTITTQWHGTYRFPTMVAEPLRLTSYSYDTQGNLLTKTIQPTTDTNGGAGLNATAAGTPRTVSYTYNSAGQVLSIDGARTDVSDLIQYAYDT